MRRAATTLMAAAVLATAALGGCAAGAETPSVAAQVGDAVIAESTVQSETTAFADLMADLGGSPPTGALVLNMDIRGALAAEVEEATGVYIQDSDLALRLTELGRALYETPGTKALVVGTTKLALLQEMAQAGQVDPQAFVNVLIGTEVNVNPRYGEWLIDQLALSDGSVQLASRLMV
jgi:parvulin-like peptidyl-prolyl isomerase